MKFSPFSGAGSGAIFPAAAFFRPLALRGRQFLLRLDGVELGAVLGSAARWGLSGGAAPPCGPEKVVSRCVEERWSCTERVEPVGEYGQTALQHYITVTELDLN